ncbi:MAG: hypothetical protein ACR2M1_05640 [Gemmatimonadaceae bacterium]
MDTQVIPIEGLKAFVTLAAVVAGALLAMLFGVRRTKAERRWNAKYDAYQQIFAALEDVRFWAAETIADIHFLPTIGEVSIQALGRKYYEAQRTLSSHVHVGRLIISAEARERLDEFVQELWREEYRYREDSGEDDDHFALLSDHAHKVQALVEEHAPIIENAARRDLR